MALLTRGQGLPLWADYPLFLRRHRALLGALVGLGLMGGLAWSLQQPAAFSATASLALTPVPVYVAGTTAELVPPEVSIDTDAQLLRAPQVVRAVADALGVGEAEASARLSVTASPHSRVLHVRVSAIDARSAATGADAAVVAMVEVRREALGALRPEEQLQLRLRLSEQERMLAQAQAQRLVVTATDELFAQVFEMRTSLEELEQAREVPATVLGPAAVPTDADHANTEVYLTSGALLGLLAGCLLGAARDREQLHDHPTPARPTASGAPPDAALRHEDHAHAP